MQDGQHRHRIHRPVQRLPTPAAQPAHGPVERSRRQSQQQQKGRKTHQNERPFGHVLDDVGPFKTHVKPRVAQQVQTGVAKGQQAQQAAKTGQLGQGQQGAQGRHRQGHAQSAQCPVTGGADQGFGRIGAQLVLQGLHDQPGQGQQACPQQRPPAARVTQQGAHQKNFFRSMPA